MHIRVMENILKAGWYEAKILDVLSPLDRRTNRENERDAGILLA
jgi:hypothetical protein